MTTTGRWIKAALQSGMMCVAFASGQQAHAWGHRGHVMIDRAAINKLPTDGPIFLKKYIDYVSLSSQVPDSWRNESTPFGLIIEDPNHGWFMEQFASMKTIPRSRYEFVLAVYKEYLRIQKTDPETASKTNVRWTGTLPYAAIEAYDHLVISMRELRASQGKPQDAAALEWTCAMLTWELGHYIGDGGQPLHDTIHHDGWAGPNPHGYTTDHKIHSRFESGFVEKINLNENDIQSRMAAIGHLDGDVFDLILNYLRDSNTYVEPIYKLDQEHAFDDAGNKQGREMVYGRTSNAASMLRDLLYRAWLESAQTPVKPPVGLASAKNPAYNPETGMAPAGPSPAIRR